MAEVDGRPVGFVQIIDPEREESRHWGDCESGLRAIDRWIGADRNSSAYAVPSATRIR